MHSTLYLYHAAPNGAELVFELCFLLTFRYYVAKKHSFVLSELNREIEPRRGDMTIADGIILFFLSSVRSDKIIESFLNCAFYLIATRKSVYIFGCSAAGVQK